MRPKVRILLPPLPDSRPEIIPAMSYLLKIIKIMETFAFRFCTLWVTSQKEKTSAGRLEDGVNKRRTG
jgi:hypothetical protein